MPQALRFPGVYIEEIPSGVRTIMGVPTAIVVFIGRARLGPANEPTVIFSFDEFERQFGGLWPKSSLGYAVRDFYLNSPGGQAIIVRTPVTADPTADPVRTDVDVAAAVARTDLALTAKSPGSWGNALRIRVDHDNITPSPNATNKLFNLTVRLVALDAKGNVVTDANNAEIAVAEEVYRGFSTDIGSPRRIDRALAGSRLVALAPLTAASAHPAATPPPAEGQPPTFEPATGGADAVGKLDAHSILTGLSALEKTDIVNLICIPPLAQPSDDDAGLGTEILTKAIAVAQQRRAMLILDPPTSWTSPDTVLTGLGADVGDVTAHAAVFFPRIRKTDSTIGGGRTTIDFAPCGAVAGVFARTDAERGVWKAPAGLDAVLRGAPALSVALTDNENGRLNPEGVNCLRVKSGPARVVWGARTRVGADDLASEWKYIPVRRLANFIEESLFRGTQWVVFEPNDEPLWASIRLNVGSFMHSMFRQGAFQGASPREAYFVKCDKFTTTQDDINRGIVNILVGFAPLKPAEFVVIKLQQIAGTIET